MVAFIVAVTPGLYLVARLNFWWLEVGVHSHNIQIHWQKGRPLREFRVRNFYKIQFKIQIKRGGTADRRLFTKKTSLFRHR
jgi:hypothetical protein